MWDINATPKVCILLVYNTLIYYVYTFYTGCKALNAKTIYCGHNVVVEVCAMLNIKGITLFIEKFNLVLLAHYIIAYCESVYVKKVATTTMNILDSAADQFQHTVNLQLSKPFVPFHFKVFK